MNSKNVYNSVALNLDSIINMDHEGTHASFLESICPEESADVIYEYVLYHIGLRIVSSNAFREIHNVGDDQCLAWVSPYYSDDEIGRYSDAVERAPRTLIDLVYSHASFLRYIRASITCMPRTQPIASALARLIIDREPLNADIIGELPACVSFPMYLLDVLGQSLENKFFFSEEYVKGLVRASDNYRYPDKTVLFLVGSKIIAQAHFALAKLRAMAVDYGNLRYLNFSDLHDKFGPTSVVVNAEIQEFTKDSFFNTQERHDLLNQLFYNIFQETKTTKSDDNEVFDVMIERIDKEYFHPIDKELDKKVLNYLKLLR